MKNYKTVWIISIGGSIIDISKSPADNVIINRVYGTERQAKNHLLRLVKEHKANDLKTWERGTDNIEELAKRSEGGFYAYNCFSDYHIDYVAVPEGGLTELNG